MDIAQELLKGNRLALTRAITAIENETASAVEIMKKLYPHTGHAFVLGITGPPGAGKSTLTQVNPLLLIKLQELTEIKEKQSALSLSTRQVHLQAALFWATVSE